MDTQVVSRRSAAALGSVFVAVSLVSAPIAPAVDAVSHRAVSYSVELELAASEVSTAVTAASIASSEAAAAAANPISDLVTGIRNFADKIAEAIGMALITPFVFAMAFLYAYGTSAGRCGLKCVLNGFNGSTGAVKVAAPAKVTSAPVSLPGSDRTHSPRASRVDRSERPTRSERLNRSERPKPGAPSKKTTAAKQSGERQSGKSTGSSRRGTR